MAREVNAASNVQPKGTRVTGRQLNRFSVQGANIYDHLDQADVLIRVDGDWESEADRDQYVNALAARLQAPAPVAEVPPENLPTKEHIRELAQEALDQIMEQAQVFASAWSLVGGRFDYGNALSEAHDAKDELRSMVRSLADLAAETVRPAPCAAVQHGKEQP
jgi:hypothetical protein